MSLYVPMLSRTGRSDGMVSEFLIFFASRFVVASAGEAWGRSNDVGMAGGSRGLGATGVVEVG